MNSMGLKEHADHPLAIVVRKLFEKEMSPRQQEVLEEVLAFYEHGRDDLFFSIADQVLSEAIATNLEEHLKQLISQSEESIGELAFDLRIAQPIIIAAQRILSDLEIKHSVDLTKVGRILSNPDYRGSVTKLIREKLDQYLQAFRARNIDIVEVYGSRTPYADGMAYEEYVGRILENAGWNTLRTRATGDQGADLVCTKSGLKLVVQCKFYNGNVGNAAVQEVHAARGFYDARCAVVITNAGFTRSATELAEKLGVLLLSDDQLEKFARGRTPYE